MFTRIEELIGRDNLVKILKSKILLVGVGGVGGICLETLVRSGFMHITVVDFDTFEESNLNRQILANINSIAKKKVDVAKARCKLINPDAEITTKAVFLDETNIPKLGKFDFIIDACDSVNTKIELIKYAHDNNINIISSMGMGGRLDPTKLTISTLQKTTNDSLAKKVRTLLRKKYGNIDCSVVCSSELPKKAKKSISSMMPVPAAAGLILASYVINKAIKK